MKNASLTCGCRREPVRWTAEGPSTKNSLYSDRIRSRLSVSTEPALQVTGVACTSVNRCRAGKRMCLSRRSKLHPQLWLLAAGFCATTSADAPMRPTRIQQRALAAIIRNLDAEYAVEPLIALRNL